jgi:hypothetical protein
MGELRGLSRWRARYKGVGLDETLINDATEKAGMLLVQVERFMRVLSSVVQQVCLSEDPFFYFWKLLLTFKCSSLSSIFPNYIFLTKL